MTRADLLDLIQQLQKTATALAVEDKPAQWTEECYSMLKDIHAAVVNAPPPAEPYPPIATPPIAAGLPEVAAPPSLGNVEPKKKNFWQKLGSGMKTTVVAIGAGGGMAALNAVVDSVQHGNISPGSLAVTAAGAAITVAIAYRAQSPVQPPKE